MLPHTSPITLPFYVMPSPLQRSHHPANKWLRQVDQVGITQATIIGRSLRGLNVQIWIRALLVVNGRQFHRLANLVSRVGEVKVV